MIGFNQAIKWRNSVCILLLVFLFFGYSVNDKSRQNIYGIQFSEKPAYHQPDSNRENIVSLTDFGVKPNSFENASAGIKKAIEYSKSRSNVTLVLTRGRIDLWKEGANKQ